MLIGAGILVLIALILLAYFLGFEISEYPPTRPNNVPQNVQWVGGYDGGYWIKCNEVYTDGKQVFSCEVYSEKGDCILANGIFKPYKIAWDSANKVAHYESIEQRLEKLNFISFDRNEIHLVGEIVLRRED